MKMWLNKTIKQYIDHAEKIKKFLVAMNQYTPYQSRHDTSDTLTQSRAPAKEFGVNGRQSKEYTRH